MRSSRNGVDSEKSTIDKSTKYIKLKKSQSNFFKELVKPSDICMPELDIEKEFTNDQEYETYYNTFNVTSLLQQQTQTFSEVDIVNQRVMKSENSEEQHPDIIRYVNAIEENIDYMIKKYPDQVLKSKESINNFIISSQTKQLLGILKQNSEKSLFKNMVLSSRNMNDSVSSNMFQFQNNKSGSISSNQFNKISLFSSTKDDPYAFPRIPQTTACMLVMGSKKPSNDYGLSSRSSSPLKTQRHQRGPSSNQLVSLQDLLNNGNKKFQRQGTLSGAQLEAENDQQIKSRIHSQNRIEDSAKYLKQHMKEIFAYDKEDLIRPVNRYKLNIYRESAINYEISMEIKYLRVQELRIQNKFRLLKMRKRNHQIQEEIKTREDELKEIRENLLHLNHLKLKKLGSSSQSQRSPIGKTFEEPHTPFDKQFRKQQLTNEKERLKFEIQERNKEYHSNQEKIEEYELKHKQLKQILLNTRSSQVEHYEKLLVTGLDFRLDGLTWIIRSIWHLGQDIDLNKLPTFLDIPSQSYLLEIAKLELKVWNLGKEHKQLIQQEIMHKTKRKPTLIGHNDNMLDRVLSFERPKIIESTSKKEMINLKSRFKDKNEILEQIQEKIKASKQTRKQIIKASGDPILNKQIKKVNKFFFSLIDGEGKGRWVQSDDFSEPSSSTNLQTFSPAQEGKKPNMIIQTLLNYTKRNIQRSKAKTDIETKIRALKQEIKDFRMKEFHRIFREFNCKGNGSQSYEKKFNTSFDTMLLALFGEKRFRKFQQLAFQEKIQRQNYAASLKL
ncbi:UNKNOWN [Stylonychia lemnae]|uniref:Uncharacterized protein n=1 Tax=Stylonychia lemnae TaxID=5949 RepID=A0A078AEC4_STYLE|nr:UNKNOWN [Stylonychia lemnae]|eukprot:CDW79268.1 UNKNOWN [Stylonychia lemnae]